MSDLHDLRGCLDRLTDNIMFGLHQRSELPVNNKSFQRGAFSLNYDLLGWDPSEYGELSRVEFALLLMEDAYCREGRYNFIDQYPIMRPEPLPPALNIKTPATPFQLEPVRIDLREEFFSFYPGFINKLCPGGEDEFNYGLAADIDSRILLNSNERIHVGRFVAFVKEKDSPEILRFIGDDAALTDAITNIEREEKVINSARRSATRFGLSEDLAEEYIKWIMNTTKLVEVSYLNKTHGA
ncbi:MAG: chorismate mutase [Fibrobacterota bacterium]